MALKRQDNILWISSNVVLGESRGDNINNDKVKGVKIFTEENH